MQKKVGIVTFHQAPNFGAVLQAYALQRYLMRIGIDNEIVDYISAPLLAVYRPFFAGGRSRLYAIGKGLFLYKVLKRRDKKFREFRRKFLVMSKSCNSREELIEIGKEYRYLISGSDQVWNPGCAGFDEAYFLTFTEDSKKYSYAASVGVDRLPAEMSSAYYERLKGFRGVSIREESAERLLRDYLSVKPQVHIDPTLLLTKDEWISVAKVPERDERPYILLYNVNRPIFDVDFAIRMAEEKNMELVYINDKPLRRDKRIHYVKALSPDEFIGYFSKASYVVTNSFHGAIFAIIFHKEIYVELNNSRGRNIRIEALFKMLKIMGRTIMSGAESGILSQDIIDWDVVDDIIDQQVENSRQYFEQIEKQVSLDSGGQSI